jgi:hypothetical protein
MQLLGWRHEEALMGRRPKRPGEGHPFKYKTRKELQAGVDTYFTGTTGSLTLSGLALHLGVDVRTLLNYKSNPELFPAINNARCRIMSYYESLGQSIKNPSLCIFMLKNLGLTDQLQVEHTGSVENIIRFPLKAPVGAPIDVMDSDRPAGTGSK